MKTRNYSRPALRVLSVSSEGIMIPISGNTTPEAADAKGSFFDGLIRDGVDAWK